MSLREQCHMLLRKAAADEVLVDKILQDAAVADELVGYHCQQAVEKLLKARLVDLGINYPKTHNLQTLIELLEQRGIRLPAELADLDLLTPYAIFTDTKSYLTPLPLTEKPRASSSCGCGLGWKTN